MNKNVKTERLINDEILKETLNNFLQGLKKKKKNPKTILVLLNECIQVMKRIKKNLQS